MIFITDTIKKPLDEGGKVGAFNLIYSFQKRYPCKIITVNCNLELPFATKDFRLNKLLFGKAFYEYIRMIASDRVLYIPSQSITHATFVRAKLLGYMTSKQVSILSLQPVKYSCFAKVIWPVIRPAHILAQSSHSAKRLASIGMKASILTLGVDDKKFYPCDNRKKAELRKKYSLDTGARILLHVGHIKWSRNIEWLIEVKRWLPDVTILVVGSTTTIHDEDLYAQMEKEGIIVMREYIPSIEEIYHLADCYIFPVLKNNASIETPLSVLEAMSTNLPVLTTRFGCLPDIFYEDEHFRFINSPEDIVVALKEGFPGNCNNREKIQPFTWDAIADKLYKMI
ncbi:MAG: glycosyltransferase family 4 protein [Desulfobacterales bacterium]|nr:glycosyltransferase family 4 protein [Desulfobacterales bacterium]